MKFDLNFKLVCLIIIIIGFYVLYPSYRLVQAWGSCTHTVSSPEIFNITQTEDGYTGTLRQTYCNQNCDGPSYLTLQALNMVPTGPSGSSRLARVAKALILSK